MNCASGSRNELLSTRKAPHRSCLRPGVNGTLITSGEVKFRLFMVVLVIAIVVAMTEWVYVLGWVALKTHLAGHREATMPTQRARVSTRASLPNTLLVRSSSRHLGIPGS